MSAPPQGAVSGPAGPDAAPAERITSADQALRVAGELAADFGPGAAERDRLRQLPYRQIEHLSAAGLLAVTVPAGYGGRDLAPSVLAEVVRILAAADPNIAQIPHSHFVYVNLLRLAGAERQRRHYFDEVGGTRSAAADLNLDHFWRNARTHTLHDPVRWKYQHLGRALLHDTPPPLHGVL